MQVNMKYEEAMSQAEELVKKMERGDMDVDSLAANVKRARELIGLCRDKLTKTEEELAKMTN